MLGAVVIDRTIDIVKKLEISKNWWILEQEYQGSITKQMKMIMPDTNG